MQGRAVAQLWPPVPAACCTLRPEHRFPQPPKHPKAVYEMPALPPPPSLERTSGPKGKQVRNNQLLVASKSKPAQDRLQKVLL